MEEKVRRKSRLDSRPDYQFFAGSHFALPRIKCKKFLHAKMERGGHVEQIETTITATSGMTIGKILRTQMNVSPIRFHNYHRFIIQIRLQIRQCLIRI